jgi:hypothetical protein
VVGDGPALLASSPRAVAPLDNAAAGGATTRLAPRAWLWATIALSIGAFAVAVTASPSGSTSPAPALGWLLFLGSSVHVASTGWLYTLPEVRRYAGERPLRFIWAPVCLVVAGAAVAATIAPADLPWLLLPFFAWQFFHFQKQNLGMAALGAAALRVRSLRPVERRAIVVAGLAGVAGLVAHPGLLQLHVRSPLREAFGPAGLVFAGAVWVGLASLARRAKADRPPGFCLVYAVSLAFPLPIFLLGSPYAAVAGMTLAHGMQYLLLVGLVAAGSRRGRTRLVRLAVMANVALVGGALLAAASHLHSSGPAGRLLFGGYLGIVTAHFVVDAGLWRLRDPFPRSFLSRHAPYLLPPRDSA